MNAPSVAVLQVKDLAKRVQLEEESLTILESVNLTINPGESVAIIGPSGSGRHCWLCWLDWISPVRVQSSSWASRLIA